MAKRPTAEISRLNKVLPRLELATALELTGGEDEVMLAKLLRSAGDSRRMTIFKLAQDIGVSPKRVVECYRDMKRLEGIVAVASRLPKVMDDVAQDAESRSVTCASCEGTGRITIKKDDEALPVETKLCIPCEGSGKITQSGDPVARKQVLEMMELTGKASAPIWAPGSNILATGESLEETLRNIRKGKEQSNGIDRNPSTIEGNQSPAE